MSRYLSRRQLTQSQLQGSLHRAVRGHQLPTMPMHMIALKTRRRRSTSRGNVPTPADQDFALRNLQAMVYQAIYEEGSKWMPLDTMAGTPAG
eukprot:496718-Pyramimonas_sp.AAC.1